MVDPRLMLTARRVEILAAGMASLVGLIAGLLVAAPVGLTLAGAAVGAIAVALRGIVLRRRTGSSLKPDEERTQVPPLHSPEGTMKKLLFDVYQPTAGAYVVREIEQETRVVPSTKSGEPAPIQVRAESVREFTLLDFFDLDADATLRDIEPKSEFHSLLDKVLLVLKDVLFDHTVGFFWANKEKIQMVLESMATDSTHFMASHTIAVADIQQVVSHLHDRGMGVLITDHNVRETLRITDRAYIMYEGKILLSGTATDLASDPEARKIYLGERFQL